MELINILKESRRMRRSGRKVLRKYGINDDAEFTQPMVEMHPGKAIRTILNWLTLKAKDGYEIELRIPVPEQQTIYESKLHLKDGTIFVQRIQDAPRLIGKALHQWDINVNYQTLTLEEIRSVQSADITNLLQEDDSILKDYVATVMKRQPGDPQEDKQNVKNISNVGGTSPAKLPEKP